MKILLFLLLLVVIVIAAVVGFFVVLAARSKREYDRSNEVVPGLRTTAPKNWAGAHTPEAVLHRRLRDVVVALRAIPGLEGVPGRLEVEQLAVSLDERLVAVAALPVSQRGEPMARLTEDVNRLETAVGQLTTQIVAEGVPVERALASLSQQLRYLAQARAELDALSSGPDADALAAQLNQVPQPAALPPQSAEGVPPEMPAQAPQPAPVAPPPAPAACPQQPAPAPPVAAPAAPYPQQPPATQPGPPADYAQTTGDAPTAPVEDDPPAGEVRSF